MSHVSNGFGAKIAVEIEDSIQVKKQVMNTQPSVLGEIVQLLIQSLRDGNKIMLFGNGGSAADAQHIAGELVSKFRRERRALPAIALTTDTSILTSIANDYSFEYVFARQIEALGRPGDVAIGISTSGNSPNVINGIMAAKKNGMTIVGFTGQDGGKLKDHVDFCFRVPSESTPRIQEVHITVAHAICELIEQELFENDAASRRIP